MATTKVLEQPRPKVLVMQYKDLAVLLGTAAVVGLVSYALYIALDRYAFTPLLCEGTTMLASRCAETSTYASGVAMAIGALGALFTTVQQRVYRPLLVVLFVTVSLWGILQIGAGLAWWLQLLVVTAIFSLAYGLFAWIVQIRNLYLALGLGIFMVIALRLILSS